MTTVTLRQLEEIFASATRSGTGRVLRLDRRRRRARNQPLSTAQCGRQCAGCLRSGAGRSCSQPSARCANAAKQLLAIYHSHPRATEPQPSETDVRLAFYPQAIYFIVGLAGAQPVMRAFRISEADGRWEEVEYAVADE